MSYSLLLHPLALQEMEESYQWYEQCVVGLGDRFLAAIQKKLVALLQRQSYLQRKKPLQGDISNRVSICYHL